MPLRVRLSSKSLSCHRPLRQAVPVRNRHRIKEEDVNTPSSSPGRPRARRHAVHAIGGTLAALAIIAACSPAVPDEPSVTGDRPSTAVGTSPSSVVEPTSSAAPRSGNLFFAGSANIPVTVTIPAGWDLVNGVAVLKSDTEPTVGVGFYDVANIYADGCRWEVVEPAVGPSVDDLVNAYQAVTGLNATQASPVTVDGFDGKQIQFTVPDHDPDTCQESTFGLAQSDNAGSNTAQVGPPNLWALSPNQQNRALILDVNRTRLVVYVVHPPDISTQDQAALDTILDSIQIG